ncbi:N-acetyltransferase [Oceanobacillus piezotolerans]|uniref:N-acetyltransferase n=1 Tax=Oceanobacillus piezotolerans TaxID=2448030 RepID=A0A498DJE4_9BACI|nr:GNAT family protein [Oceanobacillus piezotolerans]RLL42056.1 N-acetyltransferase [Oceanobacillus piezotolerans]
MVIREVMEKDAEHLAQLISRVESESPYMLYGAGERNISAEKQIDMISQIKKQENSIMLVATVNEELVGYLFALGGNTKKNRHTAYLVIGIVEEHQGKGIGARLFDSLEQWAKGKIHRLELTVIKDNIAAIKLYEKAGFEREGIKRDSLYMNGKYVDEYYMSKLLEG